VKPVNPAFQEPLSAVIQPNHGFPKHIAPGELQMNKLVAALIAGLFATSVYAQTPAAPAAPAAAPTATTDAAPAPAAKKAKKAKKSKKAKKAAAAPAADAPAAK
jgi:hypothetical protein